MGLQIVQECFPVLSLTQYGKQMLCHPFLVLTTLGGQNTPAVHGGVLMIDAGGKGKDKEELLGA